MMICLEQFAWRFAGSDIPALHHIDLHIRAGELVVVAGPSGAGKSTLALAMCGLLIGRHAGRAAGTLHVSGLDVADTPLHRLAEIIGLVQQNPDRQFAALTTGDEVAFALENRCADREDIRRAADEAMLQLGIAHLRERDLSTLSGGEKQRVAIASLLACRPVVLVLDEPTASLDPQASRDLFVRLATLCRQSGLTVVIIEHKLAQLLPLRPRVIWLQDGRLVSEDVCLAFSSRPSRAKRPHPLVAEERCLPRLKSESVVERITTERQAWHRAPGTPSRTPAPESSLVDMSGVTIICDGHRILTDASLQIDPGEVVALLGPNGGGKTTLLHALMGLIEPAEGTIRTCGCPVSPRVVSRLSRYVGLVFQNADHQLVAEAVWREALFASRNFGLLDDSTERYADRLLARAGLSQRLGDHPYRLSWGQKRRLNLISAVLHRPRLLLLDEPFAGQDWENVAFLLEIIRRVCGELNGWYGQRRGSNGRVEWPSFAPLAAGEEELARWGSRCSATGMVPDQRGACLMVTHDPRIVQDSCTRIVFVSDGRIALDAPLPEAFARLEQMGYDAYVPASDYQPAIVPASGASSLLAGVAAASSGESRHVRKL